MFRSRTRSSAMLPQSTRRGQIARASKHRLAHGAREGGGDGNHAVSSLPRPAEESALLAAAPVQSFARDQLVFDQNVALRAIFLIDDGSVRVEREDRGAMIPIAVLGVGEFFGEMSFVDGTPTSARVIADEPTRLRVIDTATFDSLNKADPGFAGSALSLDCRDSRRAAAFDVHARLRRPVLGMMQPARIRCGCGRADGAMAREAHQLGSEDIRRDRCNHRRTSRRKPGRRIRCFVCFGRVAAVAAALAGLLAPALAGPTISQRSRSP